MCVIRSLNLGGTKRPYRRVDSPIVYEIVRHRYQSKAAVNSGLLMLYVAPRRPNVNVLPP